VGNEATELAEGPREDTPTDMRPTAATIRNAIVPTIARWEINIRATGRPFRTGPRTGEDPEGERVTMEALIG